MSLQGYIGRTEAPVIDSRTGRTRTLPPDMLLAAVKRLRILAYILLGFFIYSFTVSSVLPALGLTDLIYKGDDLKRVVMRIHAVQLIGIVSAVAMVAVTWWRGLTPTRVLQIGAVFQVFGAYLFSHVEFLRDRPQIVLPAVPLACVWILAFPLIPASLRRSGIVAFAAAATGPLSLIVARAIGRQTPPVEEAVLFYMPIAIAAFLSTLMSGVIYKLAADVTRQRKLGSYQLVRKLGEGAMGEIWQARHRSLIRPAAIKLLRPELLGDMSTGEMSDALRRFVREAQATALLTSPHTVALYDFGRTHEGVMYYVMELLAGVDLEELVRRFGPQPASRAVHILKQICASLGEAHNHGLVHRDIKPANLQLTVIGGEYDFAKVLDFGLVKHVVTGSTSTLKTADNVITGTPAYLAPEGAEGGNVVDARSDLYSVGCVAYWLITGTLVFEETKPMAMLLAHIKNAPTPPSQRTELPIPAELERLILDLLAKDPATRPQTAAEVMRRLDAIEVADPWTQERAERWWSSHLPDRVSHELDKLLPGEGGEQMSERTCEIVRAKNVPLGSGQEAYLP